MPVVAIDLVKFNLKFSFLYKGITNPVDNVQALRVSENSVTLNWDVPYTNNLKMYEIEVENTKGDHKFKILTERVTSQYEVQDLHSGTMYKYRVRAVGTDENKKGPWSKYQTFVTGLFLKFLYFILKCFFCHSIPYFPLDPGKFNIISNFCGAVCQNDKLL